MVIYTATNDGYLHAIDPDTGEELWAFVPSRLLGQMQALYEDDVSSSRLYGLDGEITAAILNDDKKGGITGDERVVLIFGMRRGGDAYFAVDVTDRYNPELLWEIDSTTPGFTDLGQTWSTPQHARVRVAGGVKEVAFIGGGYDPVQDNGNYRTDNQGNAVYMINIEDGQRLWSAGKGGSHDLQLDKMEHGVPAPLRVVDLNGDGLASRLYFGDMGGRVWRIDIINGNSADELGKGGLIASLGGAAVDEAGGTPATADLRRFYNQADVVDVSKAGYQRFVAVNIGSGYRAHPLSSSIDERFFSIKDLAVDYVPENDSYDNPVVLSEMVDITGSNGIDMSSNTRGWVLRLVASSGEKILSRSITFSGTIFVTSFAPGSGAGVCNAVAGRNRLYAISLFNGDTQLEDGSQYIELAQGGIAPQVELLYVPEDTDGDGKEEGQLMALIGTEDVALTFADPLSRTYWTQDGAQ
jgi:type IV pilus assembly protein PilY1